MHKVGVLGWKLVSNILESGTELLGVETISIGTICLLFISLAGISLVSLLKPIVFDSALNRFYRERELPDPIDTKKFQEKIVRLDDIYAIQLLCVIIEKQGRGPGFKSYEMNLVLTDGKRVNVIGHGDDEQLLADAILLCEFLKKPVWNAMDVVKRSGDFI